MGADPEVRELSLAYARAVAVAERLAHELDQTVADLVQHVRTEGADVGQNETSAEEVEESPSDKPSRRGRRA